MRLTFSGKIAPTTNPYHRLDTALYPGLLPLLQAILKQYGI
jgi:hypothetical protein